MAVYYLSGCPCCSGGCDGYSLYIYTYYDTTNNWVWQSTEVRIYDANGNSVLTESWTEADTIALLGMPASMTAENDYTATQPHDLSWTLSCGTVTLPADSYLYAYTPAPKTAFQPWVLHYTF